METKLTIVIWSILLLLMSAGAFADGPKYTHRPALLDDEIRNIYRDIKNPKRIVVSGQIVAPHGSLTSPGIVDPYYTGTGINFGNIGTNTIEFITNNSTAAFFNGAQQFILSNGSAARPSVAFMGDGAAGLFLPVSDTIGFSAGLSTAAVMSQVTNTDHVTRFPLNIYNGASDTPGTMGAASFGIQTSTGIDTAPNIIMRIDQFASINFVAGNDGSNFFQDLVFAGFSGGTPVVIGSQNVTGGPAARTYAMTASQYLTLAMASGTYDTIVLSIQLRNR